VLWVRWLEQWSRWQRQQLLLSSGRSRTSAVRSIRDTRKSQLWAPAHPTLHFDLRISIKSLEAMKQYASA
jgi:hypothetical protein